jgi:hypothetical protein
MIPLNKVDDEDVFGVTAIRGWKDKYTVDTAAGRLVQEPRTD